MEDLMHSPLDDRHRALGAKMVPFGGWDMPLEYSGTLAEHAAVRDRAGIFDVSHLGKLRLRGGRAADLLDRALTNRYTGLAPGRARYTLVLDDEGGIIDDMIVYALHDGSYIAVPNASNTDAVAERLGSFAGGDVEIERLGWSTIAVQGPLAIEIVAAQLPDLGTVEYMTCVDVDGVVVARSGYTGEPGYELFAEPGDSGALWDALLERVVAAGGQPAGLGARDTLRLEMGYPLHGNDIDRDTTPAEAGLGWAVAKDKPAFAGKEAIERREPRKRLCGLRMIDRQIPRHGHAVYAGAERIGDVTSGNFSPTLRTGIALASVMPGSVKMGGEVAVDIRGRRARAEVVRPPFVDRSPKG